MRGRCFIGTYVRARTVLAAIGSYGPANITANIFAASGHCRGCVGVQTNRGDRAQL